MQWISTNYHNNTKLKSVVSGTDDLTEGEQLMSTYVTSDLHGYFDAFMEALNEIKFNASDHLYVLGDVIDKGPHSIRLLRYIMEHPNIDLIIGNHEFMMLNSVNSLGLRECSGDELDIWLNYNEGRVTLKDYYNLPWIERCRLLNWLKRCYVELALSVEGKNICLSHSFFNPILKNKKFYMLGYEECKNIVWNSVFEDDFDGSMGTVYKTYNDCIFISGHIPVQLLDNRFSIFNDNNIYVVDGGCALDKNNDIQRGILLLRIDDMKGFSIPI